MVYMACFLLSALFAHLAYKAEDKRKIVFFSIISILITVLLAGLRDYSIGIDVENYRTFKEYWSGAYFANDFYTYMKYYLTNGHNEILFALYLALIDLTTNSFRVFLVLSHLIIITLVYIGAYRQRHRVNPAVVLLLFYFCFFHHSLNVIRQYIAMSIIFVFLKDLEDGKYFRYILAVIVAMLIHTTAIIGLGAMLIHIVLYAKIPQKLVDKFSRIKFTLENRMKFIIISLGTLVVLFKPLCLVMMKLGILSSKYNYYMSGDRIEYGGIVSVLLLIQLAALIYLWKDLKGKDNKFEFYFTNSACYFILYQLSAFIAFGKRIAIYFCLNNLITLAFLGKNVSDVKKRRLVNLGIWALVIVYWLYIFIFRGASETYPYSIFNTLIY